MARRHGMWMVIGCALPLVALLFLPLVGVPIGAGWVILAVILICPVSHLLLMRRDRRMGPEDLPSKETTPFGRRRVGARGTEDHS